MAVVDASTLTVAERLALLQADHLTVDAGLELLDADDVLIEDISDDFVAAGSTVERGIYRTIHGTARLLISKDLLWGSQRLRPYMLLSSDEGATFYRWDLGVFVPSVPERVVGESLVVFQVECFDKLDVLNTPHGSTYSVAAGAAILPAVEALITAAGESKQNFDQTSAAVTATSDRVFSLVDDWTTLGIVNDLLESIGYEGCWVDRFGNFRSRPYRSPADRPTVWSYDADDDLSTMVGEYRTFSSDYFRAANQIVAIRDDPGDDIPVDGDGIVTLTNQSDGLTSVNARGGRTIRRVIRGEYASQAALVTAATEALDTEKRVADTLSVTVSPNPVHGHFDVVEFKDAGVPVNGRFILTDWVLPLDGSPDMSLSMRAV